MGKRGQNEGSIYQRKDGRYVSVMTIDQSGKRKYFYGKTKAEVVKKLRTAQAAMEKGIPPSDDRLTVARLLDDWLNGTVKMRCRPRTQHSYAQLVRVHLKPGLGKETVSKLTPQRVNLFLQEKLAAGLAPRTVQYLRAVLRSALNVAMKHGLVARNVAALADPPKLKRRHVEGLEPERAALILTAVRETKLEALFTVILTVGLRIGEALALKWEDVNLDEGTIHIRNQLQRIDGKLVLSEPKSESSRRDLPLASLAVNALKSLRARQEIDDKRLAGERWQEGGFVFTTRIGTPLESRNVRRAFSDALTKANLPPMRLHDLRHGFATLLISQNVSPKVVSDMLGHSQIALTMNTYAHPVQSAMRNAANSMDSLLKPKPPE